VYQTVKLGTRDISLEYRYLAVEKGTAEPTPAEGYSIVGPMPWGDADWDWYMEYRTVQGKIVPGE